MTQRKRILLLWNPQVEILFHVYWNSYDALGSRTLARNITSSGTSLTIYVFGLEEHVYNSTGSTVSNTYYYTLDGRLIGKFDGTNTQYYLTDAQGSVLTTFGNAATTTSVLGEQSYGPYGNKLSSSGSIGTAKGIPVSIKIRQG